MLLICTNNKGFEKEFTLNKIYLSKDTSLFNMSKQFLDSHYLVKNDLDQSFFVMKDVKRSENSYGYSILTPLVELRDEKINQIIE